METSRRNFLKIGGLCVLGLSSLEVANAFAKPQGAKFLPNPQELTAKRWAMAINMRKCWEKGPPGCQDCILACDWAHNVPDIPVKRQEIKWIYGKKSSTTPSLTRKTAWNPQR